jgi:hypothetical protein
MNVSVAPGVLDRVAVKRRVIEATQPTAFPSPYTVSPAPAPSPPPKKQKTNLDSPNTDGDARNQTVRLGFKKVYDAMNRLNATPADPKTVEEILDEILLFEGTDRYSVDDYGRLRNNCDSVLCKAYDKVQFTTLDESELIDKIFHGGRVFYCIVES